MNVYLLPWAGTGTDADRFRPQGVNQLGSTAWSCIDLRADPTQQAGRCFVGTAGVIDVSGIGNGRLLGANLDATVGNTLLTFLRNQLGVTATDLPDTTPRQIIRRLLLFLGRDDGTRWRGALAARRGRFDVFETWLGGELVSRDVNPVVGGGMADYTENFTRADGTTVGNLLTATEVAGDWNTSSNAARHDTTDPAMLRFESDTATTDQYVQAVVTGSPTGGGGVALRFASAASTFYVVRDDSSNVFTISKCVAGTITDLASVAYTHASPYTPRLEAYGSTLRGYVGGTLKLAVTDTSISTGTRAGLVGFNSVANVLSYDDAAYGDFIPDHPYWIESAAQVAKTTATTSTVTIPSSGQVSGRLILVHFTLKTTSGTVSAPAGEGWSQIKSAGTTNLVDVVYAKVWGLGGQTDNTTTGNFTASNSPTSNGWGFTLTVVANPGTAWTSVASAYEDTQGTNHAANTTMTGTGVTVSGSNRTILNFFGSSDDNTHGSPSKGILAYGGSSYNQTTSTTDYSQSMSIIEDTNSDPGITHTQGANGSDTYDDIRIVLVIPSVTNATATPSAIAISASLLAATVGSTGLPSLLTSSASFLTPLEGVMASPPLTTASAVFPQAGAGLTVLASVFAAVASINTPSAFSLTSVTPSPIAATASLLAADISTAAAPAVFTAIADLLSAKVSVGADPAAINVLASLLTVAAYSDMSISVSPIVATTSFGDATPDVGAAPAPIDVAFDIPTPSAYGSTTATPPTVAVIVTLPDVMAGATSTDVTVIPPCIRVGTHVFVFVNDDGEDF